MIHPIFSGKIASNMTSEVDHGKETAMRVAVR